MRPGQILLAALLGLAAATAHAHGGRPYRFGDAAPVTDMGDRRPVLAPRLRATEAAGGEYVFDAMVRYPTVGLGETWKIPRAGDVNALDDVPASTWYTPRLGSVQLSPEELLAGHPVQAAPSLPLETRRVFPGPSGGVLAEDAAGVSWFVDFDPRGHRGLSTTAGVLANRLFWAFGQNVAEDHVVDLAAEDLRVPGTDPAMRSALDALLAFAAAPVDGRLRARASRHLPGIVLGPFSPRGVRIDDPNDLVPHENRRTLRALRVLGAWVNLQAIRPMNTLDVYVGERNQGHVRHYFLDLGQAFGGYSASGGRHWSGYNHYFSFEDVLKNLVTAGLYTAPWEEETRTAWPSVGTFEARRFEPRGWRETTAFAPIRRSRPEDDYWAAGRLLAFSTAHLEALVRSVRFPDPGAAEYMVTTLLERQRKLVDWAFSRVTPVDAIGVEGADLCLRDRARAARAADPSAAPHPDAQYRVTVLDGRGRTLRKLTAAADKGGELRVPLNGLPAGSPDGYLRVEVFVVRNGQLAPRPAEFHLRPGQDGARRLVGVVH